MQPTIIAMLCSRRVHSFLESWGIINWLALRTVPPPAAAALPAGTRLLATAGAGRPQLPEGYSLEVGGGGGGSLAARARRTGSAASLLQLRLPTVAEGVAAASAGGTLGMTSSKDARANRCDAKRGPPFAGDLACHAWHAFDRRAHGHGLPLLIPTAAHR